MSSILDGSVRIWGGKHVSERVDVAVRDRGVRRKLAVEG
jgi:hypothetical protein